MNQPSLLPARFRHLAGVCAAMFGLLLTMFAGGTEIVSSPSVSATFVRDDAGALWAWGENLTGTLADGTGDARARPQRITAPGVVRWRAVAPGTRTLAVDQDRRLWVWGQGRTGSRLTPRLAATGTNRWDRVAVLPAFGVDLAVDSAGQAWRWSFMDTTGPDSFVGYFPEALVAPGGVNRWINLAAGKEHALLLSDSGRLFTFGRSSVGATGPPATDGRDKLLQEIASPEPRHAWTDIAAGPEISFGRLANGEWYAWGAWITWTNNKVEVNARPELTRLKRPPGVATWRQVAAGDTFLLLLTDDGRPFGLGNNIFGQLTLPGATQWNLSYDQFPERIFPVRPLAQRTLALAAGPEHACALAEDGLLYTWGANHRGQLGRAANGSTPTPEPVRGDAAPFSPNALPLPRLEVISYIPALEAPVLTGQPGTAAVFGVWRSGNDFIRIPLSFTLTSPHSLPGLPPVIARWSANDLPLGMLESAVTLGAGDREVRLVGEPVLNPGVAVLTTVFLRASGPPWVEWSGPREVPLRLNLPRAWSLPPTVSLRRVTNGVWRTGEANRIELGVSDPDGWVTRVELFAQCPELSGPYPVGNWTFGRGFAGTTNRVDADWVPPVASDAWRLITVLRDHAGSVVTNTTATFPVVAAPRFAADWGPHPPVVVAPHGFALQLEDRLGGVPVQATTLVLQNSGGFEVGRLEQTGFVPQFFWNLNDATADRGEVIFQLGDGTRATVALPALPVTGRGALPIVTIEATQPEAAEAGPVAGEFRLRRWGGELGLPLEVGLETRLVAPAEVPSPRREGDATALSGRDYRPVLGAAFTSGVAEVSIPIVPTSDAIVEGHEGVRVAIRTGTSYRTVPGLDSALVLIRDSNAPAPPRVSLVVPSAEAHPASQPLAATITATLAPDSKLRQRDLVVDGVPLNRTAVIPAPLPVGEFMLRGRVTDSFGIVAESDPVMVRVVPELKLRGRQRDSGGNEQWVLEGAPDFQSLQLEAGTDWNDWKRLLDWQSTPANRVQTITVPADTDARFLRLVPAP